jgi:aspartate/methionine/tyrosine aminotransferase
MALESVRRHAAAKRMRDIAPFYAMDILARAKALEAEGRRVIHMEVGEADFPTPSAILAAGQDALTSGLTRYTPAAGIWELRSAIARDYEKRYGVALAPERIIVTPGASGALQLSLAVLIDPGDTVVLTDPGYPCNRHLVRLFEGQPMSVPVGADTCFQLAPEHIARHATAKTAAVVVASPANPTGTVINRDELQDVLERIRAVRAWLIVDETYQRLMYEGFEATALELADDVFVVNSFSKSFGMTGWRLGWLVAPAQFVPQLEILAQNLFLAPSTIAQHAALAAFRPEIAPTLERRRRELKARRDFMFPELNAIGFEMVGKPAGAFYLYADCQRFGEDSFTFTHEALEHTGVAFTPGCDFGSYRAREHVRFAYTTGMDALRDGVERLRGYLLR